MSVGLVRLKKVKERILNKYYYLVLDSLYLDLTKETAKDTYFWIKIHCQELQNL